MTPPYYEFQAKVEFRPTEPISAETAHELVELLPEFYLDTTVEPGGHLGTVKGYVLAQTAVGAAKILQDQVAEALDGMEVGYTEVVGMTAQPWPEDIPSPGEVAQ